MAKEFIKELLHWWKNLSSQEQYNCAWKIGHIQNNYKEIYNKFIANYKVEQQAEGHPVPKEVNEFGEKNKKYYSFLKNADENLWHKLTEMQTWEEMNLEWMYERTMALNDALFPEKTFFIPNQFGDFSIPDINHVYNRLKKLAKILLLTIYPNIEKLFTHDTDIEQITSNIIKGKINWNDTIINSIKQSGDTPITFTCMIPRRKFDTPENLLLLISINWLLSDANRLLSRKKEYSIKQIQFFRNVQEISKRILDTTPLKEIREEAERKSREHRRSKNISNLIYKANLRISRNISKPHYRSLIHWIRKYVGWNINRYKTLLDFGYETVEHVHKMFELWILFEIASYFHGRGFKINPITVYQMKKMFPGIIIEEDILYGFEIKNYEGMSFTLIYEPPKHAYPQQTNPQSYYTPDFMYRINDNSVPIIMDAKNWQHSDRKEVKFKMMAYLAELDYVHPSYAIGIFSKYPSKNKRALREYEKMVIGSEFPEEYQKNWFVKEANFVASGKFEDKQIRKQILDKFYEILEPFIIPAP